ncbi:hypothetical protein Vadar_017477 [Vaccinium darrowii]|uniref:Uncharacterized protein n=1 Tax=Vaccinium darrowii TaxID=229202 RepID=A0ACB7Z4H8_9ERIC|nr:hypothetical protein Vadar_017477 [Vaccinium darrowii]
MGDENLKRLVKETIFDDLFKASATNLAAKQWVPIKSRNHSITLFVDNIPEEANLSWLSSTFNNYGVVIWAHISNKRSYKGSRFAFVKYNCHVSIDVAIQKANGMQFGTNKLVVKTASFTPNQNRGKSKRE